MFSTAEEPGGNKAHFEEPSNGIQIGLPIKNVDLIDLCSSSEENDASAASNLVNEFSLSQQGKTKKFTTKKKVNKFAFHVSAAHIPTLFLYISIIYSFVMLGHSVKVTI